MLILSRADVAAVLSLPRLIDVMSEAMDDLASGRAQAPNRTGVLLDLPYRLLAAMPGHVPDSSVGPATLGTKLVSLFPDNAARGIPSHQAVVVTFDADTGSPTALMDGTYITQMRTAACSAVATRALASEDARVHAVLGTGDQALSHALAISCVRSLDQIRIAGRDQMKAEALAARLRDDHDLPASAVADFASASDGADIVSATTHSPVPVVRREWLLRQGAHVNSVGFNTDGREVDDATVGAAFVTVDSREAATSPAPAGTNDILEPIARGILRLDDIAELGDVAAGRATGRTGDHDVTLYKSVGVAVQDCAAAGFVAQEAARRGLGTRVDI